MEERTADIITGKFGEGTGFTIRYLGLKFRLHITELSTEKLIRIRSEFAKISDVKADEKGTNFQVLMDHVEDAKHICKGIAIATGTRFVSIVSRAILELTPEDQKKLYLLVEKYSNPEAFFFTITSARKTSMMMIKGE